MSKKSPALSTFLAKLESGKYANSHNARAAVSSAKRLTQEEALEARKAIVNHFKTTQVDPPAPQPAEAPKESVSPPPPHDEVTPVVTAFSEVRAKHERAKQALRATVEGEPVTFTDSELSKLFWYAVDVDALGVFRTLLFRYSDRVVVSPQIIDIDHLKRQPRFFPFALALVSEIRSNAKVVQDLVNVLPDAIDVRCGDAEEVRNFELVVRTLGTRFNRLTFGLVIAKYASPRFVLEWLRTNRIPAGVRQFSARMTALYLDGQMPAEALLEFVETLKPDLGIVEEIIRTVLVRRQLGDALVIAQRAPERYKPALHRLLHPVVVRHGIPVTLITFGTTFPTLVNRDEIKRLVRPDLDKRLDDLLDGVDPMDSFEATPTITGAPETAAIMDLQDSLTTCFADEADKPNASYRFNELFEELIGKARD